MFRAQGDLLTPVQYEAHKQAIKDANEEIEQAERWERRPQDDATAISVNAFFAAGKYILARFLGDRNSSSSDENQLTALLEDPENAMLHRQYLKQYTQSYKEHIAQYHPPKPQKKTWWQQFFGQFS